MAQVLGTDPSADPGKPVVRLVGPIIGRMVALIAAALVVCVVGAVLCEASFDRVTEDLEPAVRAEGRLGDAVSELDSAISVGALAGAPRDRAAYAEARAAVEAAAVDLTAWTEVGERVEPALEGEVLAVRQWLSTYVDPVLAQPMTAPTRQQLVQGQLALDAVDTARAEAGRVLADELDRAESAAQLRLRLTTIVALLLLLGAVALTTRTRSQLLTELSEPLHDLEQVTQRMLRNDPEGRAVDDRGPKEVRSIARALNDFADAGSRARAVEGRIQDELRVLDSAKDDFVSNVSHELRTPLTTISGYLEMVAEEFEDRMDPRHDRMLEATRRNVARLRALIDDLLALSKAENRPSEMEASDVTELVTEAVTDVRITAARRGITVEVEAADEPLPVVCDRPMLYRAFTNLLTNAVKFSHPEGTVSVTVAAVEDRVEIAVRDHGIGIPAAEIDRLGTRFFRASNAMSNEIAGTGLGLRIVQTIIDKHAGDVVIESAEGEGTTVFVRLRLDRGRAAAGQAPSDRTPSGQTGPVGELSSS